MADPQRQQFGNALEKYSTLFSVITGSFYVRHFFFYSFRYSLLPWLIVYVVTQLIFGIPMFLMEYFIGQFSSSSIISMYSVTPALKGTGITSLFLLLIWICIVIHDSGKELVTLAYTFTMPWTNCNNGWNTERCTMGDRLAASNYSVGVDDYSYDSKINNQSPYEEFSKYVLQGENIGFVWYIMLAIIIIWISVYFLAIGGIRITGKAAFGSIVFRIATTFLLLLVGLATTISNGGEYGLKMYFYPDFRKLLDEDIWMDAARISMVNQFIGTGIVATIGSYDKISNNCFLDAVIVAVFSVGYSFLNGINIVLYAGFKSNEMGQDLSENVFSEGPMLWSLSTVPGSFLWVFLYVLMKFSDKIVFCAITIELVLTSLSDAYPKHFRNRKKVALGVCVPLMLFSMIFCIGYNVGQKTFLWIDIYLLSRGIFGNLSWFIFIFVFLYGAGRLVRDIRQFVPGISWAVTWPCYLSWIVVVQSIYSGESIRTFREHDMFYYDYPAWASKLGTYIVSAVLWFTIIYAIVYLIRAKGTFVQRIKTGLLPSAEWGPQELPSKQVWEEESKKHRICCMCCGCLHPDCCGTQESGVVYDAAIPIRVEMINNPGHPSSYPNAPPPGYEYKPITVKPEGTAADGGLYPNLAASS